MKYLAAYALCVLGGKHHPTEDEVKHVLHEAGCEINAEELHNVCHALHGKELHEVIAAGTKKLGNLSFGGSSGAAAPSKAEPAKQEAKKEEKKPEVKEEEPDVGLGGGLFGDDEDF